MKKFTLQLEDLQIDSFTTTPVKQEKGTVFGEQDSLRAACTSPGYLTCDGSCDGTCGSGGGPSCNGTCAVASCGGTCDWSCGGEMTCEGGGTCYATCRGWATIAGGEMCDFCG